ncbi:MAG: hypothetical protein GXP27_01540 [Planctomycetes bacterium]|nr:hypothetical protein [Planctomycetota bacterium]
MPDSSGTSDEAAGIGAGAAVEVAGIAGAGFVTAVGIDGTTDVGATVWPNAAAALGGTVLGRTWPVDEDGGAAFRSRARRVRSFPEIATERVAARVARLSEAETLLVGEPFQDPVRVAARGTASCCDAGANEVGGDSVSATSASTENRSAQESATSAWCAGGLSAYCSRTSLGIDTKRGTGSRNCDQCRASTRVSDRLATNPLLCG